VPARTACRWLASSGPPDSVANFVANFADPLDGLSFGSSSEHSGRRTPGTTGHASPQPIVMSMDADAASSSVSFLGPTFERSTSRADAEAFSYGPERAARSELFHALVPMGRTLQGFVEDAGLGVNEHGISEFCEPAHKIGCHLNEARPRQHMDLQQIVSMRP
jgi:hypothetical protein